MNVSLKKRTQSSAALVTLSYVISQGVRLASNLVLTRLLIPEMFGLMALVNVILSGILLLLDVGFLQSIVKSKKVDDKSFLNTIWSLQIITGLTVFLIAQLISLSLFLLNNYNIINTTSVYGDARLPLLLSVMALTSVISSTNSIYLHILTRKLTIKKVILLDLFAQIIGITSMIILAWQYHSIWALVIGGIIATITKSLISHTRFITPQTLMLELNKEHLRDILHFGKWIALTSVFGFLINQGDRAILGGLLSANQLGVYAIAYFIASSPKMMISKLISSVFFPVLSETIRERRVDLPRIYYEIKVKIDAITYTLSGFLIVIGPVLISILYDDRYHEAGWMLQYLSAALPAAGFMLVGQCFLASGNSKVMTFIAAVQVITLFISVPIFYNFFDIKGAILAIALNPYVRVFVSLILMKKYFFIEIKKEMYGIPFFVVGYIFGEAISSAIANFY